MSDSPWIGFARIFLFTIKKEKEKGEHHFVRLYE